MTPVDVNVAARDLYNATNDTFFTDSQIYNWMWQGCHDLARKAFLIERVYTTTTVAGTQAYTYPANTIAIKRISVNGKKLKRITMRDDDAITLSNQASSTMGQPVCYTDFNYTVYLRPIPDAAYPLTIYSYNDAQAITATSALEIPSLFHFELVDYILFRMFAKDKDIQMATFHGALWTEHVKGAIAFKQKMKRSDSFATVQSEENLPVTILGES